MTLSAALAKAEELGSDLIEISPNANPPIGKIMDYGKYQYNENKKQKATKGKTSEVKTIQVKVGTGEHDLGLKAKKTSEWLAEGHRVKIDLFLPGRTKYMQKDFLEERLDRILKLISVEYRTGGPAVKSPKGLSIIVEKAK